MPNEITPAVQDYLKAIHGLGGAEQMVSPVDIADRLEVRAPSVTGMLKRLAEAGLIRYEPGHGARLTDQGVAQARRVIRRHRLLELFLTRVLGLDWSEVDAEADALEHAISPRLEQALAAHLGEPLEDPHGHPIPTREGQLTQRHLQRLCDFRAGQRVLIREAQDDNPERLRRWQSLGLTPGAVVHILSFQFGASSLYLLLKVGMTVSASVPIAVLSITLFRAFSRSFGFRRATILENNIVQTTGSAGESIAFGVGVTMPALLLLGFEMSWVRVMTVSVLGGLLGILMMIPLRRAFIVKQHGKLKYPEGTACAEVLVAGEKGGSSAKMVFIGFGIAFVYKLLNKVFLLWAAESDDNATNVYRLKGAAMSGDLHPE